MLLANFGCRGGGPQSYCITRLAAGRLASPRLPPRRLSPDRAASEPASPRGDRLLQQRDIACQEAVIGNSDCARIQELKYEQGQNF
ncbi:hypothetical protein GUJ93_ZPchr0005g15463 [Zizania palustris]|uniref:Uncharacterized protein n=1 Tax=Zizania palustris TaxID=103762 RepID=A0A8J5SN49_ZIZPA|nr:hypothetical protein GUJ93_ZPchr0005g15463 [Zizania palustris]